MIGIIAARGHARYLLVGLWSRIYRLWAVPPLPDDIPQLLSPAAGPDHRAFDNPLAP